MTQQRTPQGATTPVAKQSDGFIMTGLQGRQQVNAEIEKRQSRANKGPQRVWLNYSSAKEFILLDAIADTNFTGIPFYPEHEVKIEGTKDREYVTCIASRHICPLCQAGNKTYGAMLLSVIELFDPKNPIFRKDGTEIKYVKKLLCVKKSGQDKFFNAMIERLNYAKTKNPQATLRGLKFTLERGADSMSLSSGEVQAPKIGSFPEFLTEQQIIQTYGHAELKSKDGQVVIKAKNADCFPFDYAAIATPDVDAIQAKYGNGAVAGSSKANYSVLNSEEGYNNAILDEDEVPFN